MAISLRYEQILGNTARRAKRALEAAAFTALTNALLLSLWAILPRTDLGYPATALAVGAIWSTLKTHYGGLTRRDTSKRLFSGSLLLYVCELVVGSLLVLHPANSDLVYDLAYAVFGAFGAALARSWQLLQPEPAAASGEASPSPQEAGLRMHLAWALTAASRAVPRAMARRRRGTPDRPG
ncbi:MAG: hypothetical protein ACP5PW_07640 [Candidatus Dormibacteria bacterium]